MRKYLSKFWRDERGYVLAMEWIFVASLLSLGALAGMMALHHAGEERADWTITLTR
jgi:Flp pilus assembly pilin Flp